MKNIKGWRTFAIGLLFAAGPITLQYLAGVDWTKLVSPTWAPVIAGAVMIGMRLVTNTSPGSSE